MFYCRCFFLFLIRHWISELPCPIAVKLSHMIDIWLNFIMQVQKFGEPSPKKFSGPKTCKIWGDFTQLPNLITNISGTTQDVPNQKANWSRTIPPAFEKNKSGELWSTIQKVGHVSLDPPKSTFSGDYISAPSVEIITRARDWPRLASAHHKPGRGSPKNFKGEQLKLGLEISKRVPITIIFTRPTNRGGLRLALALGHF